MPRVLIVDDSSTMRAYVRQTAEARGCDVVEAINGVEALEKALLADHAFSLLLVDVNMPQMDGYRFVAEARRTPALATVPIVMMSTESEPGDRSAAFVAGANGYRVKPVAPAELGDLIELLCPSAEVTS